MTHRLVEQFDEAAGEKLIKLVKQASSPAAPGADSLQFYLLPGTTAGTVRVVARAGATGPELTVFDDIRQNAGTLIEILKVARALIADGTSALPAYGFASDSDLGLYRIGADAAGFAGSLLLSLPGYTLVGLPAAGTAGRLARVTDDNRGLRTDTGTLWSAKGRTFYAEDFDVSPSATAAANTTALQALLDAVPTTGATVVLPPGNISHNTININRPVVLIGSLGIEPGGTRLNYAPATGNAINIDHAADGTVIRDIKLFSTASSTGIGISAGGVLSSLREFRLEHVEIEGFLTGVDMNNSINAALDQVRIIGHGKAVVNGRGVVVNVDNAFVQLRQVYIQNVNTGIRNVGQETLVLGGAIESAVTGINATGTIMAYGTLFELFNQGAGDRIAVATNTRLDLMNITVVDQTSMRQENPVGFITYDAGSLSRSRIDFELRSKEKAGSALAGGDFALSANWGTTASVGTITGSAMRGTFNVTSAGTGQAVNPTVTITFPGGAFITAPFATVMRNGGSQLTVIATWVSTTTTLEITFRGTPVATETYAFAFVIAP